MQLIKKESSAALFEYNSVLKGGVFYRSHLKIQML